MSEKWFPDFLPADLQEVLRRLPNDPLEKPADFIFYHALSAGEEIETHALAAELMKAKKAPFLVINGSDGSDPDPRNPRPAGTVWPGAEAWTKELTALGVPKDRIIRTPSAYNTEEEADRLVTRIHPRSRVIILTLPHRSARALLYDFTALKKRGLETAELYAACPTEIDWDRPAYGSQARERKPLWQHAGDEAGRILAAQQQDRLCPTREFLNYLDKRMKK